MRVGDLVNLILDLDRLHNPVKPSRKETDETAEVELSGVCEDDAEECHDYQDSSDAYATMGDMLYRTPLICYNCHKNPAVHAGLCKACFEDSKRDKNGIQEQRH